MEGEGEDWKEGDEPPKEPDIPEGLKRFMNEIIQDQVFETIGLAHEFNDKQTEDYENDTFEYVQKIREFTNLNGKGESVYVEMLWAVRTLEKELTESLINAASDTDEERVMLESLISIMERRVHFLVDLAKLNKKLKEKHGPEPS